MVRGINHNVLAGYFLPRGELDPPEALVYEMLPWLYTEHHRLSNTKEDKNDDSRNVYVARCVSGTMLKLLRIFLQDAVILRPRYPTNPIYTLPLFGRPEWEHYSHRVRLHIENRTESVKNRLHQTNPNMAIQQLNGKLDSTLESFGKMIQTLTITLQNQPLVTRAPRAAPPRSVSRTPSPSSQLPALAPKPSPTATPSPTVVEQKYALTEEPKTVADVIVQVLDRDGSPLLNKPGILEADQRWPNWYYNNGQKDTRRRRLNVYAWCLEWVNARYPGAVPERKLIDEASAALQVYADENKLTMRTLGDTIRKAGHHHPRCPTRPPEDKKNSPCLA